MNTQNLNEIHNSWYAGLDEGRSQKEVPVTTKTFTDDEVYKAIQGKNSLDALLVWRLAEAAHGITESAAHGAAQQTRQPLTDEQMWADDRIMEVNADVLQESPYDRGFRHGYNRRDAEVKGALV